MRRRINVSVIKIKDRHQRSNPDNVGHDVTESKKIRRPYGMWVGESRGDGPEQFRFESL